MKTTEERIAKIKGYITHYETSLVKSNEIKLLGLNFSNKEADKAMLKRLNNRLKKLEILK